MTSAWRSIRRRQPFHGRLWADVIVEGSGADDAGDGWATSTKERAALRSVG
jgi:hypothetical protein